nr:RNA-directed DNA polymerase, eukaryota [Tanacetum cinerariifolium]
MENSKKSFVYVFKRGSQSHVTPEITKPALVLDETCIKEFDFGMSLIGRAKDVYAIHNIPCIISKEGFQNVKLLYLRGMWVLFEFDSLASKEKFLNHSGISSWFTELIQATSSLKNDEWIVWISIEGLPIKAWTPNTFCKVYWIRVKELDAWFPNFLEDDQDDLSSDEESQEGDVANKDDNNESDVDRESESNFMQKNDTAHKDEGNTVIMGDFNEVRSKHERFGSMFNKQGAIAFNKFISSTCLIDLPLEGKSNDEILIKRIMLLNDLQELNNRNAIEISQKTKSDGPLKTIIDDDVFQAVRDFFVNGHFPRGCNSSFIAFITKIQDAKFVKYFRSISLIGSVYKIIAKILANRLCVVLPYLISDVQSAFVANLQILDGPFILNELLSWCKFKKLHGMIFKVDFEKDFDSVKWDYLDKTIKAFGFGSKWRNWISSCLDNAMGSVLVNGSLTLEFQFYKGLKQVFIGEWNNNNIQTLLSVLRCFYLALGLKINLYKSKLIRIGVSSNVVAAETSLIGCSILTAHFNYLGVKVGSNMSRITSWDDVIFKVSSRLSKWKLKLLFIGGRLSLLKSVLSSIPLYHMSIFKVPIGVLNHLESIRRNLFYGVDGSERKLAWIGWNMVLTSKKNGGALDTHKLILRRSPWQDVILAIHSLQSKGINLMDFFQKKVGNGENTSFWDDSWLGEVALKVLYKMLYALEMCKSITVAEKMGHPSLSHSFPRMPRGGVEQENYGLLCSKVGDLVLPNISDKWCWSLEVSQKFLVKSSCNLIDNTILPKAEVPTRWLRVIPIKVNVHAWRVCLDKLPTIANLSLRGMDISSIACPLCNSAMESSSHIFFTCPLSRQVWRKF